MRDLSKQFSDKMLKKVLKQLEDAFHYEHNGYNVYNRYEQEYCDTIDDVVKYYGLHDMEWEEYGFFFGLIELNPNYQNEETIKVPKLGEFFVFNTVEEKQYVDYTYRNKVYSYGGDSMIKDQLNNHEDFYYYEGDLVREEVTDSEVIESRISDIQKIKK
jgi:hypothetical protein